MPMLRSSQVGSCTCRAGMRAGGSPLDRALHDHLASVASTPRRRARGADVGVPLRWVPERSSADEDAEQRMNLLRAAVVGELARQQNLPDPSSVYDLSPFAAQVFSLQPQNDEDARPTVHDGISLNVGERATAGRPFGKRVFEGGIPRPPTVPGRARFGKRMHIEMEAKRRSADAAALHTRKPDVDSVFSDRYALLRNGILNVDGHKPALRLPSATRDQRRTFVVGLPTPAYHECARPTESARAYVAHGQALPATRSAPRPPPRPAMSVYTSTATGAVMQFLPRHLVDVTVSKRRVPETERTHTIVY
jgi:hypothetical protein